MRRYTKAIGVLAGCLLPGMATAFVPTLTPHGDAVKWVGGRKLNLAGNPTNNSGITETFFRDAVVRGLQRWFQASGGAVGFDYWQGTDRSVYEPSSEYNGLSSIYFASQSASGQVPGTEIIGLTQVWYDQDNGNILEADVVLNDVDYVFTQDPTDTSGTGSGKPYSGFDNHVYLENVVTHELGHAMGLSHSGGLQATMLFLESPEQAHLSCDDILGIRAIYGPRSLNPSAGELRGKVLGPSGTPVVGAQVVAVSETRGAAMTYGLTGSDGSYRITALEPGAYSVMVEPYYAGSETLPSYYSTMNANVCGGASFSRTFVTESDGFHLKRLAVPSGSYVNVPDLRVQCNGTRNASVMGPFGAPSTGSAPALENAVSDGGFSVVDRVQTGTAMYYKTTVAGGALQVRTVAYGLYSPVGITLELLDSGLHSVATQSAHPVYSGDSGFNDYDAAVIADNLSPGTYYVKATAQYLSSSRYPAASLAVDYVPFIVLMGRKSASAPPFAGNLAFNARCRMDENFAVYRSPAGPPARSEGQSSMGACGTIASVSSGDGPAPPTPPTAILGWFLPWGAALAGIRGMRLTVRRRRLAASHARG